MEWEVRRRDHTISVDHRNRDRIPKTATVNRLHSSQRAMKEAAFGIWETRRELHFERDARLGAVDASRKVRHENTTS